MIRIETSKMAMVVAEAKQMAAGNASWVRAIDKAAGMLGELPHWHYDNDELLVLSASGEIYKANGTCQCKAFANGMACWHRAGARLMKRYEEQA